MDELIRRVTGVISSQLYPDNCGVILADLMARTWRPHFSYHGISDEKLATVHPLTDGIVGKTISIGMLLRSGDIRKEQAYKEATERVLSEICAPIFVNGQIFGAINAESRQLDAFSGRDEHLLLTIADNLATAVEKIRLVRSEQRRRRESEALREAMIAMTTTPDLNYRFGLILDYLGRLVNFDSASIAMYSGDELEIVAGAGAHG